MADRLLPELRNEDGGGETMKIPKYFYFRVRVKGNHHGKAEIEVEDASNEDVVEIVRCADCKH